MEVHATTTHDNQTNGALLVHLYVQLDHLVVADEHVETHMYRRPLEYLT